MSGSTTESLIETLKKKLISFKLTVKTLSLELDRKQGLLKVEEEKRDKVMQLNSTPLIWVTRLRPKWLLFNVASASSKMSSRAPTPV